MGKYINGPADNSTVIHIPEGVREVCRRPLGAQDYHHYIRAQENFYWVGKCTHEPLFREGEDFCPGMPQQ